MNNFHDRGLMDIIDRFPPGWGKWIDIGPGWYDIVRDLDMKIEKLYPNYEVHQVKEKFGGLRYYTSVDDDIRVINLIDEAERRSFVTCEYCGRPGRRCEIKKWWKTLCEECEAGS